MITKITGIVNRVLDEEIRLQVGPLEYQVLVPEFVRRILQSKHGQEITLHTSHYLEGNPAHGRMVPRLIGFLAEAEQEFFDLFCTVDKVGVRKAMKALVRPDQGDRRRHPAAGHQMADDAARRRRRDRGADRRHAAPQGDEVRPDGRRRRPDRRQPARRAMSTATCWRMRIRRCSASAMARRKRAIGSTRCWQAARVTRASRRFCWRFISRSDDTPLAGRSVR